MGLLATSLTPAPYQAGFHSDRIRLQPAAQMGAIKPAAEIEVQDFAPEYLTPAAVAV
jgi:hypothetical protein